MGVAARGGRLSGATSVPLAPGLRQTRQRRLVWKAIERMGPHCTADEIVATVRKQDPDLARSTVYRALEALTASGTVWGVRLGDGPIHYELAGEEHQHAVCSGCKGVLHLEHELVRALEEHLEERHRFTPVRTEVLVVGVCAGCAQGKPPTARRTVAHVHYQ